MQPKLFRCHLFISKFNQNRIRKYKLSILLLIKNSFSVISFTNVKKKIPPYLTQKSKVTAKTIYNLRSQRNSRN